MTATDETLDWQDKNILSCMVVTFQLCKHSEELRDLSALNLLPTNEQDPRGASPTMEVQVAARVMADMLMMEACFWHHLCFSTWSNTLASQNTS